MLTSHCCESGLQRLEQHPLRNDARKFPFAFAIQQ